MAATMASAFTTDDRRKRIATYGKPSRPATKFSWDEDAPSPERIHKHAGSRNEAPRRPAPGLSGSGKLGSVRKSIPQSPASRDVFDVPDDGEQDTPASPITAKKAPPKPPAAPKDDFDVPSSGDETAPLRRPVAKVPQPLRKSQPAPRPAATAKALQKPDSNATRPPSHPIAPPRRREKTPQPLSRPDKREQSQPQTSKRSITKANATSRGTTPASPTFTTHKRAKSVTTLPPKKPTIKTKPNLDEWDVPFSDEDAPILTPKKSRPAPVSRAKSPTINRASASPVLAESDDSNASRKRKRQGSSQPPIIANGDAVKSKIKETTIVPRSKKYQKKEDSISPGHGAITIPNTLNASQLSTKEPSINKPKRTRVRTTPSSSRGPVSKGQSSPAQLHSMLAVRSLSKPSPIAELPERAPIEEDETMYDIQDPSTPIPQAIKRPISGSVTPRQMQMFSNLLGDSSETTPGMPSIRRLQLTDRKPESFVAGLARSSSDVPQSAYTRRSRLIDTLRQDEPSSDDDGESESDEEMEEDAVEIPAKPVVPHQTTKLGPNDEMKSDHDGPSQSQASQSALHMNTGSKVTYGQQRSYLEETNLEDGLLLGMDFDDPMGFDGLANKRHDSISEDEDDPTSQVRGIHELRKQGFNQKFQLEAQTSIDDIAGKAGLGKSLRRTALLQFCSQMADTKFLDQLLESALSHQFLASIGYTGEIIFDFAASVAVAFILESKPGFTVLEEIHRSNIMTTLTALLGNDVDISRIAKDRKTNLSRSGRESVDEFRALVQTSSMWNADTPDKVTPQIVALGTLESLILALRAAGSTETLVHENVICKLLDVASTPCERLKASKATPQDMMILNLTFSIMESASISNDKPATWSNSVLQRLVTMMTVFFNARGASPIRLAIRLCVLLTNNKPRACELFADPPFMHSLVRFINYQFDQLAGALEESEADAREELILSLGAVINIAEFSDQARRNVVSSGDELVDGLTKTFLEGSERAAQADSVEASTASIPIGYLSVLLGNLCLNDTVRSKIRVRLPEQKIDLLVEKVKEFVSYHERADRLTNNFEGEEGRETSRNYTMRLLKVVERLQAADS